MRFNMRFQIYIYFLSYAFSNLNGYVWTGKNSLKGATRERGSFQNRENIIAIHINSVHVGGASINKC